MADTRRWGPGKQVMQAMRAGGVDPGDEDAIDAWLREQLETDRLPRAGEVPSGRAPGGRRTGRRPRRRRRQRQRTYPGRRAIARGDAEVLPGDRAISAAVVPVLLRCGLGMLLGAGVALVLCFTVPGLRRG